MSSYNNAFLHIAQIKLLRRSNLSELSNVLDSWRPTIVYISSGLTTMQRAGLEKRNLEPLDIISTEAGKESLMTLLSTLSPEAVYFDASGCHAIGTLVVVITLSTIGFLK